MNPIAGWLIIGLVAIMGIMYGRLWYKYYSREQALQDFTQRPCAQLFIFFNKRIATTNEMWSEAVDTYASMGIRTRTIETRPLHGCTTVFENNDVMHVINIAEDWTEKVQTGDALTLMIDDTVDLEMQRQIIEKLGLKNRVFQLCFFNDDNEED